MERRGCGLGCIVAWLGLALTCCLLPYLISSIYMLASMVFDITTPATWLWWDWISTWPFIGENETLSLLFGQGPMCCVGALALLFVILGVVMMVTGAGKQDEPEEEEYLHLFEE